MKNNIKGYHFKLEYNVLLGEEEDNIGYKLEMSNLISAKLEEDSIELTVSDEWYVFSEDEAYVTENTVTYLGKYAQSYEYYQNRYFGEYEPYNLDIDDFGDTDEGWNDYMLACDAENESYENSIDKVIYVGFIASENTIIANNILNEIIKSFCLENNIK